MQADVDLPVFWCAAYTCLASVDPNLFYKLLESVCRRWPQFKTQEYQLDALFTTGNLFDLPFTSIPILLHDRSCYKSYTSAWASWCKSVIKLVPDLPAGNDESATRDLLGVAAGLLARVEWLTAWMQSQTSIASSVHKSVCISSTGQAAGASPSTLLLLLLVNLSRAVAVVIERLQSADFLQLIVPHVSRACMFLSESTATSYSCSTPSPSSSSNSSSHHTSPLPFTGLPSPTPSSPTKNSFSGSLLQTAVCVGSLLLTVLAEWHNAADAARQAAGAVHGLSAPQPRSATTAGKRPGAAVAGRPALQVAGSTGHDVPRWLSKLPQECLPGAVVYQLQHMSLRWVPKVLEACVYTATEPGEGMRCEGACQQQLQEGGLGTSVLCSSCIEGLCRQYLEDVMQVINTLLDEVPLPLGCNNPACVNLEGKSEAAASHRACNGCKVACYCSIACQKAHWKRHKAVCQCLQQ